MRPEDFADLYAVEDHLWWFRGMRAISAALLDPLCRPGADRLVLDAGCGTGGNLGWLRRYAGGGRVIGLDVDPSALGFCRARGQAQLAQASLTALPFAGATFDLVTSFDVLPHVVGPGADGCALREIHRVLRPRGVTFIRGAAYRWMRGAHDTALDTQRRYSLSAMRREIERAGLRVLRATYANTVLLPLAAAWRLGVQRLGPPGARSDVRPLPRGLRALDPVLRAVLGIEASYLRRPRATLPLGLSSICVAERPPG